MPATASGSPPPDDSAGRLAQRLTVAYVAALALVALLSGVTHLLLDRAIAQQHDSATLINVAGLQRMLSQRIALLASDLQAGHDAAQAPLAAAIAQMERGRQALVQRNDLGISTPLSPAAQAQYLDGADPLDGRVRTFIAAARRVAEAPAAPRAAADVAELRLAAQEGLLPRLDAMVSLYEAESRERVDRLRTAQQVVLLIILGTLALEATLIFRPMMRRLRGYAGRVYDAATRDSLTGLLNRRAFREAAERALLAAAHRRQPAAVLAIDIDGFRQINDRHGQAAGDTVLQRLGVLLREMLAPDDLAGRTGDEEFAVLLAGADRVAALMRAEALRAAVEADDGSAAGRPPVTVSIGLTVAAPTDQLPLDLLLSVADARLYGAKAGGRNRVVAT